MNQNSKIQYYNNQYNSMFDDSESEEEIKDSIKDSHDELNVLTEVNEPGLFHCILNMMNDKDIPHESNKYLKQDELDQIDTIYEIKPRLKYYDLNNVSYFSKMNYKDFSIIFKYLKKIAKLNNNAFFNCENLQKIILPNTIETIGEYAFQNCENLQKIILPENKNFKIINDNCFMNCINLNNVILPNSITYIYPWAFSSCSNLSNIHLSKNLIGIFRGAFNECMKLKTITIPDSIKIINNYVFSSCSNLKQVKLPKTVSKAFIENLKKIFDEDGNENVKFLQ